MLSKINDWIDNTIDAYQDQRISCASLPASVTGFFSAEFLQRAYYVVLEDIPKPYLAKQIPGADAFLAMPAQAITYKTTYFIRPNSDDSTHLHELVHVAQWSILGVEAFMLQYIDGVQRYGYRDSPLERMAYTIQYEFEAGCEFFDVPTRVASELNIDFIA